MSLNQTNNSKSAVERQNEVAELKQKVEQLEEKLKERVDLIESDLIFEMVEFLNVLSKEANSTWEKSKSVENTFESSNALLKGVIEIKDKLYEFNKELLGGPEIEPEKQRSEQLDNMPSGISINVNSGKHDLKIDTDLIEDLVVQYRYSSRNIEPLSGVVIRELCKSAIETNIHHGPRNRRIKLNAIYESRSFKDKLVTMLGYYPKIGVGERDRILEIVSVHIQDKYPEIY